MMICRWMMNSMKAKMTPMTWRTISFQKLIYGRISKINLTTIIQLMRLIISLTLKRNGTSRNSLCWNKDLQQRPSERNPINRSQNGCSEDIDNGSSSDIINGGVSTFLNRRQDTSPYVFKLDQYPGTLWENDNLPDPRLYNSDVHLLRH